MSVFKDVKEFHKACDVKENNLPSFPAQSVRNTRHRLLEEEVEEYADAEKDNDIVGVADALADIMYIVVGTARVYGIPLESVWNEVHKSNMTKVLSDGTVKIRDDGKILKPATYRAPDIEKALFE